VTRTLLVLGASPYQLDAIRTARRLGWQVLTTDCVPGNPGHALADRSFGVDTTDLAGVLAIARAERIDGIIAPCTDVAVPTAAYVAQELGLHGIPPRAAAVLCDKIAFRAFQAEQGLPHPEVLPLETLPTSRVALRDGAWVLKPARASGSKGIFVVRTQEELEQRLPETLSFDPQGRAQLERFIDGTQHTAEGVLRGGRITLLWVTDRDTAPLPYVATHGHRLPAREEGRVVGPLREQLEHVFAELVVREGPFDCDFVMGAGRLVLLEVTPRLGGNSLSALIRQCTGFDLVEYAVRAACAAGAALPETPPRVGPGAVVLLGVQQDGHLRYDSAGEEALRREPWVRELTFDVPAGSPVQPFIHGRHRVGQARLSAATRESLDAYISLLRERLALRAEPAGRG
jgi:biotin carboxylase